MELSQLGEFGLIKQIKDTFTPPFPPLNKGGRGGVVAGIGDDCAAIKPRKGFLLIATTDALVEGIHFKLKYISPYQLGVKSININLSDIAAMGGIPLYALLSIAVPPSFSVKFMDEFLRGVKQGAQKYKVSVIGGNISSSPPPLLPPQVGEEKGGGFFINITLLGEIEKKYMTLRKGAKAGDKIFVTGCLGDSAAGMDILKSSQWSVVSGQRKKKLVNKHLMPIPRLEEGRFLAVKKLATSMIDISDGLASDIRRICEESNVGANIFIKNIPISKELKDFTSSQLKTRNSKLTTSLDFALYGGEDYELLFTVRPKKVAKLRTFWKGMKTPLTMIGEITNRGINLVYKNGKTTPLKREGYNHFIIHT
ncbi:MAG: thiamine-phosphate kinase [Nitrospinota bacterium]